MSATKEKMENLHHNTEIMKKAFTPTGYSILIEMLDIKTSCTYHGMEIDYETGMTKGVVPLHVPETILLKEQEYEATGQVYARIVKMGPDCYTRMHFDPEQKWCKEGQLVRIAQYGGEKIKTPNFKATNLRLINDNDVLGILDESVLQETDLLEDAAIDLSSNEE